MTEFSVFTLRLKIQTSLFCFFCQKKRSKTRKCTGRGRDRKGFRKQEEVSYSRPEDIQKIADFKSRAETLKKWSGYIKATLFQEYQFAALV